MSTAETLKRLVESSLPQHALFEEENFAGDAEVKIFYDALINSYKVDLKIFVSWACEPNVHILKGKHGNILVRSERLDTLLIEYVTLLDMFENSQYPEDIMGNLAHSTVLRWMSELLIGQGLPCHAVSAFEDSFASSEYYFSAYPYRDDCLESVPEDLRTAIQCFSLAHEVGHLMHPKDRDATLNTVVDGLRLMQHIEHDFRDSDAIEPLDESIASEVREEQKKILIENIDAPVLTCEIDADLFALECVVDFMSQRYDIEIERIIKNALLAFEALAFMNSCKGSCSLLKQNLDAGNFTILDYVTCSQVSIRARCITRRCSFIWAKLANPGKKLKAADINPYVANVDEMILDNQQISGHLNQWVIDNCRDISEDCNHLNTEEFAAKFNGHLAKLNQNPDQKNELWKILIAYGCSGDVDVVQFLQDMFKQKTQSQR